MTERPKVGVGVLVFKDGKILMQRRIGAHGEGSWSAPGGHLEFGEDIEACARREVMEESGLEIKNLRFLAVTNDVHEKENKHYITVMMAADYASGDLRINPQENTEIGWFDLENLPRPLFVPIQNLIENKCFPQDWKSNLGP